MEVGFGFIEGETSKVLEEVISKTTPPKYFTHEHTTIITFALLLHARTKYSAEEMEEAFDQMAKKLLSKYPQIKEEDLKNLKFGFEYPAQAPVSIAAEQIFVGFDLAFKLLINNTTTPFITSDHPVVFYNQLFEPHKTIFTTSTGPASKGHQIFLPLSPKLMILFYDSTIYDVGEEYQDSVLVTDQNDINSMNGLQYLNALSNLYFNQDVTESYINFLETRYSSFRRLSKSGIEELYLGRREDDKHHSIVSTHRVGIQCGLTLSFIKLTDEGKNFNPKTGLDIIRNVDLYYAYKHFMSLVDKGLYKTNEFKRYLDDLEKNTR